MDRDASTPPAQKGGASSSAYLHPYACFRCRKSFKRASRANAVLTCPDCGGPSIGLTRKFKPPKRTDIKQWEKVEALVRHGFLFWSLGEPYPETLDQVTAFAQRHAGFIGRERAKRPDAYAQIEAALSDMSGTLK
ncbi:hypothetical protein [Sphingomonas alpina]|uniref:Uncharacterized protein n=1 Tax=Sphingomonas alpina TaxID=653931 RepID=A0A7H0LMX5_9SPHN|nr:hypothetical protein [Sphingomonas alpina]QNQ11028.1 hypothetical protein H3Z74_07655 [Sphingomonas alpina]